MQIKLNKREFFVIIFICICCTLTLCSGAAADHSIWRRWQSLDLMRHFSRSADNNNNNKNNNPQHCPVAIGNVVNNVRTNYLALFKRYLDWSKRYKQVHGPDSQPGEAMKREFARIDAQLFEEEIEKANQMKKIVDDGKVDLHEIETPDYLFKALTVLVDQLESKLASGEDLSDDEDEDDATASENEQLAKERVKRIALKSFGGFVTGEVLNISRLGLFYSLANIILVPGNPLFFMAPFMQLVVNVQTPMLTAYMQNVQVRTVFNLIDSCNPVTKLVDEWFKAKAKKQD